jgi:hypothetical protein
MKYSVVSKGERRIPKRQNGNLETETTPGTRKTNDDKPGTTSHCKKDT